MDITIEFSADVKLGLAEYGFDLNPLELDLKKKKYFKSNGFERPDYLGKDAPFTRPQTITDAEVHHIHIRIDGVSCPELWDKQRTTDSYLVYTWGDMNNTLQSLIEEFHGIQKSVPTYRLGQHFINELIKESSTPEMCKLWEEKDYNVALGKVYEVIARYQWDVEDLPLRGEKVC